MRTLTAGLRALKRTPVAAMPFAVEGLVAAVLMGAGALPAGAAGAASVAAFPMDVYFDVKQAVAFGSGWPAVVAAMLLSALVRGGVLAATAWLHDPSSGRFPHLWARASALAAAAGAALLPAAGLFFTGVATRYAPFIWLAAVVGLAPAFLLARSGVRLGRGGSAGGGGVPEPPAYLAYAYAVAAIGMVMSALAARSAWASAAFVACTAPLHAVVVLGWRERLRTAVPAGRGGYVVAATGAALVALAAAGIHDRYVAVPPSLPVSGRTTLGVLGGVDSTSTTGALSDLDPSVVGIDPRRAVTLSYRRRPGYSTRDTHRDLDAVARAVAAQMATLRRPRALLGHSQAALVLDRMLARGLKAPDVSVQLAAAPPVPPPIAVRPAGEDGRGRAGSDAARAFARLLAAPGLPAFDVDAPAAPGNLDSVVVAATDVPRLAVWALGDSVWLTGDWRRPGEVNLVALTDHVGVTNDARTLDAAARFLAGERVDGDERSWRSVLVGILSGAFGPWRPG